MVVLCGDDGEGGASNVGELRGFFRVLEDKC